jgi:hypothetical protein
MPETYPPVLQRWKATILRKQTGDDRYVAGGDLHSPTFMMRLTESIKRPFILTANEVIIVFVCFYQTVIAVILFTFIDGFDNIFRDVYGVSLVSPENEPRQTRVGANTGFSLPFRVSKVLALWA